MTPLPDEIRYKATIRDEPIAGIPLMAGFGVTAKNSYSFIFGPTDSEGVAAMTKADILLQAEGQMKFALMDYRSLEEAFSGDIGIKALSHEDARRALDAFAQFRKYTRYPQGYQELLETALKNPVLRDTYWITITRLS